MMKKCKCNNSVLFCKRKFFPTYKLSTGLRPVTDQDAHRLKNVCPLNYRLRILCLNLKGKKTHNKDWLTLRTISGPIYVVYA